MNTSSVFKLIRMWSVGAALFALRMYQINHDFDNETGLHTLSNAGIALFALILAAVAAAFLFTRRESRQAPRFAEHFASPQSSLPVLILGSFLLGAGGALFLSDSLNAGALAGNLSATDLARLATAVLAVITCFCFLILTRQLRRGTGCTLALILPSMFFAALWVLTLYLPSANDPVLARYCLPIVAAAAAAAAFSQLSGFFRRETRVRMFSFVAECAVFLCIAAAAQLDANSILFLGCALLLTAFTALQKRA